MAFLKNLFSLVPVVKADEEEELVDPQAVLREECGAHCQSLRDKYEACNERVRSKSKTAESCAEELIDFLHCIDHCVTPQLLSKLK